MTFSLLNCLPNISQEPFPGRQGTVFLALLKCPLHSLHTGQPPSPDRAHALSDLCACSIPVISFSSWNLALQIPASSRKNNLLEGQKLHITPFNEYELYFLQA